MNGFRLTLTNDEAYDLVMAVARVRKHLVLADPRSPRRQGSGLEAGGFCAVSQDAGGTAVGCAWHDD